MRYRKEVDGVFNGVLPENELLILGKTPSLMVEKGAPNLTLKMTQSTVRKMAYPENYQGGRHNLGIEAVKRLPEQLSKPQGILISKTQGDSVLILTEWNDTHGDPVIVPIHFNKNGIVDIDTYNAVATGYGKPNLESIYKDNSDIIYPKNKSISDLLARRLQLPLTSKSENTLSDNITDIDQKINEQNENNSDVSYSISDDPSANTDPDEALRNQIEGKPDTRSEFQKIRDEVVAETVKDFLFETDNNLELFVKEKPNAVQRVLDAFNNGIDKIRQAYVARTTQAQTGINYDEYKAKQKAQRELEKSTYYKQVRDFVERFEGILVKQAQQNNSQGQSDVHFNPEVEMLRAYGADVPASVQNNVMPWERQAQINTQVPGAAIASQNVGQVVPGAAFAQQNGQNNTFAQRGALQAQPAYSVDDPGAQYSYNALVAKPDMEVAVLDTNLTKNGQLMTNNEIVEEGLKKLKIDPNPNPNPKAVFTYEHNNDTGVNVYVTSSSLYHGMNGRRADNKIAALNIAELIKNGICTNEFNPLSRGAKRAFNLLASGVDSYGNHYAENMLVEQYRDNTAALLDYEDVKGTLYSANNKKMGPVAYSAAAKSNTPSVANPKVSVADFLYAVKDYFSDVLSDDVVNHFGIQKKNTKFSQNALYSISDDPSANTDPDEALRNQIEGKPDTRSEFQKIRDEVVAETVKDFLFETDNNLELFVKEKPNAVQRVLDAFNNGLDKIRQAYVTRTTQSQTGINYDEYRAKQKAQRELEKSTYYKQVRDFVERFEGILVKQAQQNNLQGQSDVHFNPEAEMLRAYGADVPASVQNNVMPWDRQGVQNVYDARNGEYGNSGGILSGDIRGVDVRENTDNAERRAMGNSDISVNSWDSASGDNGNTVGLGGQRALNYVYDLGDNNGDVSGVNNGDNTYNVPTGNENLTQGSIGDGNVNANDSSGGVRAGDLVGEGAKAQVEGSNIKYLVDNDLSQYLNISKKNKGSKYKAKNEGKPLILKNHEEVKAFIDKAITAPKELYIAAYSRVSNRLAEDVSKMTNGEVDIRNFYLELNPDDLKHSFNRHGEGQPNAHSVMSKEEFEQIPQFIDTYDKVLDVKPEGDSLRILLVKKLSKGNAFIVEVVSKGNKSLQFKDMFNMTDGNVKIVQNERIKRTTAGIAGGKPHGSNIPLSTSYASSSSDTLAKSDTKINEQNKNNYDKRFSISDDPSSNTDPDEALRNQIEGRQEITQIDESNFNDALRRVADIHRRYRNNELVGEERAKEIAEGQRLIKLIREYEQKRQVTQEETAQTPNVAAEADALLETARNITAVNEGNYQDVQGIAQEIRRQLQDPTVSAEQKNQLSSENYRINRLAQEYYSRVDAETRAREEDAAWEMYEAENAQPESEFNWDSIEEQQAPKADERATIDREYQEFLDSLLTEEEAEAPARAVAERVNTPEVRQPASENAQGFDGGDFNGGNNNNGNNNGGNNFNNDGNDGGNNEGGEPFQDLIDEYGAMERGEQPRARDVLMPNKTGKDRYLSQFARNLYEANATTDEMIPALDAGIRAGDFSHERISNERYVERLERAAGRNNGKGINDIRTQWESVVNSSDGRRARAYDIAAGQFLYNQYVKQERRRRDRRNAVAINGSAKSQRATYDAELKHREYCHIIIACHV